MVLEVTNWLSIACVAMSQCYRVLAAILIIGELLVKQLVYCTHAANYNGIYYLLLVGYYKAGSIVEDK